VAQELAFRVTPMKRNRKRIAGPDGIELFEEAAHLLRGAPLALWLRYYLGVAPFVLGLLFFWADMSRNAWASQHVAGAAAGLAVLFVWMKCWQAVFVAGLHAQLSGEPPPEFPRSRAVQLVVTQAALQTTGLVLLPLALVTVFLFPAALGFYQSLTFTGTGATPGLRAAAGRALRLGTVWPGLNYLLVALFALAAFMLFINIAALLGFLPQFARMFLGVESTFTRAGAMAFLNTTFIAACAGVAWLVLDPVVKAVFLLRCFYAECVHSGEDLRVDLRRAIARSRAALAALALLAGLSGLFSPVRLAGAEPPPPPAMPKPAVAPQELSESLDEVLRRAEFAWRLPRERTVQTGPETWWDRFIASVRESLEKFRVWVLRKLGDLAMWVRDMIARFFPSGGSRSSGTGWITGVNTFAFLLLAVALSVLAILFLRLWKQSRSRKVIAAEAVAAAPDLNDENVVADQLPEDGWLALAQDMMRQGNLRLALRALYLATLAHLARREVVRIARFKTNLEYEREVRRRARALPELQDAFARNVGRFDRAWYGLHEVTPAALGEFESDVQRIRLTGTPAPVATAAA